MDPHARALAWLDEGTEERVQGRLEEAERLTLRALEHLRGSKGDREALLEALEQLAWILRDLERPGEALTVLEEGLRSAPVGSPLRQGFAEHAAALSEQLGDRERAATLLGAAEELEVRASGGESLHRRWLAARRQALEAAGGPAG